MSAHPVLRASGCDHSWRAELRRVPIGPDLLRWDAVVVCVLCDATPDEVAPTDRRQRAA